MDIIILIYLIMFFFGIYFLLIFVLLHYRNLKELYAFPEPKRYPLVSFFIPAYNEEKTIKETVDCILKINYPQNKKEIIIINDGSKDNTLKIAQELARKNKEVKVLNKENSGKANSLNEALKIAKGELIAVVDADSYPVPDSLRRMVGYFEDQKVGAVTSRVLVKNKNNILTRFQVLDYSIIAWTRKLLDFVGCVYVTNGPLSVYRKSIVIEAGGFDPKNLTEDIEITWNILSRGYKTKMSYSAIVYTSVPENLSYWIKQRVRWNLGGLQTVQKYKKYFFKNPQNLFGYFVIPYVAASFILAIIGFLLLFRFLWIKGIYHLLALSYISKGYDYFKYLDLTINFSLLLFLGLLFFVLAIFYYKIGFKHSETGNKGVLKILAYSFFYRSLYVIPLLIAIYKLFKGDIRWYTK